ncbi:hypothetical protein Poly30_08310 [Planctomycetes bacterium Poly30]|uniref:Uncharacterized protein n=1 Tax=Saltatorellus ferox TaxID=2528018 RepID=A0A518EML4_9BACT|nr:hypothetical protein Poly30_08310 [Planctomycetes bacterium Poly30]
MRYLSCWLLGAALGGAASAQVQFYPGHIPNPTATIDFDNPFVASGPIASNSAVFTGAGISSITPVGAWITGTDLMTIGSNVDGQGLVVAGGVLGIAGPGQPLDNADIGDGFDIVLTTAVDQFEFTFVDQIGMTYEVELFSGATSLGVGTFYYHNAFPAPPLFFRAGAPFDRVLITFPNGSGGVGLDFIQLGDGPPPPALPNNCVETTYVNDNQGDIGGMVYFDLTTTQQVMIEGLSLNTSQQGTPIGLEVYTTPGTYVGNESNAAAWTLVAVDDGTSVAMGTGFKTPVTFASPITLPAGTVGVALVGRNSATGATTRHAYVAGNGANQIATSNDGRLTISAGAASNGTFAGTVFSPRVFNGTICAAGDPTIGTRYCSPANVNSSGMPGSITVAGSSSVAMNDVELRGDDLPSFSFGFFLTSTTQGFVANPAGSQGNLCLAGAIGRFVGSGQIQNSGVAGTMALAINLNQHPTPTGLVAVQPGQTWNYQLWFRDSVGGTAVSNFTDGVSVMFQ